MNRLDSRGVWGFLLGVFAAAAVCVPRSYAQSTVSVEALDHAGIIGNWDAPAFDRGEKFFRSSCVTCHGALGQEPTHPRARRFGKEPFKYGGDPYAMYQTLTHGAGAMLPQTWLAPAERYDVIHYIREAVLRKSKDVPPTPISKKYLSKLPKGTHSGERSKSNPRDFGPLLTSQIERRVNLAMTFALGHGHGLSMSYDIQRMAVSDVWKGALDLSETQHVRLRGERQPVPTDDAIPPLTHWYWCIGEGNEPPPSTRHEMWIDGSSSSSWLPPDLMRFNGHYVYGRSAVLSYAIKGRDILEMPGAEESDGLPVVRHTLRIESGAEPLTLCVGRYSEGNWPIDGVFSLVGAGLPDGADRVDGTFAIAGGESASGDYGEFVVAAAVGDTATLRWTIDEEQRILLNVPASEQAILVNVLRSAGTGRGHVESFARLAARAQERGKLDVPDLSVALLGGPRLWRDELHTAITYDDVTPHYDPADYVEDERRKVAHQHFPYTVDTIALPEPNPWNAWMRMSDLAFFDDGTLAVSTLGGDIWLVEGVEPGSEEARWTRYASGLFEPLGLRVFDGQLYATCRGGIVRLHDLNEDGQADFYENFHSDHEISNGFHAYNFDLHRDEEGNLYYIKPGLYTDYRSAGAVVKVSPDGSSYDLEATGFRVPNGMGQMPDGTLFATDNQGQWVPANKINRIKSGAFYGVFQSANKDRDDYEKPMMWLPQEFDNSPGNLVYVSDKRFGPLSEKLIVTSFGKGWAYYVMPEVVGETWQGAAAAFPFQFRSGLMRAAVNPNDGQVYVTGLTGWDTESTQQAGCLQRIRYTGDSGAVLIDARTHRDGVSLEFSAPLDSRIAADESLYEVERWNYRRAARYGSDHWSVETPEIEGHDEIAVVDASVSVGGRSIRLKLEDMAAADTIRVRYTLRSHEDEPVVDTIYLTIHTVSAVKD